ncbi:hypothetical protein CH260_12755 [Rhodococcus sp. 05-2256-B2]|nr:hypothetical protein CH258_18260 [Rhodococcus sp. 05-2256-B4]OZD96181.1 hypothetical protein CH260_12755 [Rhodococcus sp. 05-2256-B2]OZD96603.1 hypothetical protein CH257_04915 [Rhodococcus sp. 05-2256-B3]OZD99579.1 hypothetical protein CH285_20865 [Rhodococcus sp. 05-2256-B1]
MRQAEIAFGFGRETYRRWARAGEVELHRHGGKLFVDHDELAACIEANHGGTAKVTSIEEHIAKLVAAAPPMTPETRARIARLLGVSARSDAA